MNMPSRLTRGLLLWLTVLLGIGILYYVSRRQQQAQPIEAPLSKVAAEVRAGNVAGIEIAGRTLNITLKDGSRLVSRNEDGATLTETLRGLGVAPEELSNVVVQVKAPAQWNGVVSLLAMLVPGLLVAGLVFFMLRQSQGAQNQALSFGRSRARLKDPQQPGVTFSDVAGAEEAKQELVEVVEFLKEPEKFISLGARIPKGVLLVGSPGTGKTLLAKAVSGEAGVPFFSIAASEFVEMFVGVGASRVRDLFTQAKRHSPCIVFVDEIDAVGRHRGAGLGGSHDEREQTLNQILVEMDGFNTDTNVIIMAATNRPDILDPALLRPGRFDRRVVLDRPDMRGREAILQVHTKGKPVAAEVDLTQIARATPGFVGADLENVVNEAAILAARRDKKQIGPAEFQEAVERVIAGPERKSRIISEHERRVIAFHEAGHALVMQALPECDPVRKVSIIPRGMAGGYTLALPADDRTLHSRSKFRADLAAMLGGRVAEELAFADVTTGAADDLERATQLARAMVTRYGMSEALGPMIFGQKQELVFLGREIGEQRDYSEEVAAQIDAEVRALVNEAYQRAKDILTGWRSKLDRVAAALLEEETIDGRRLAQLCEGEPSSRWEDMPDAALAPVETYSGVKV